MQYSKQIKRIINMIVLVVVLSTLLHITGLALEPISYSTYFNHDTEIIDGKNESYDLIFVGASRVYRSFVPKIFEEKSVYKNVLNAGSSSQSLAGSYYETKDLIERYHPKTIVLGVTFDEIVEYKQILQGDLIVYDRLIKYQNKVNYFLSTFKGKNLLYGIKAYRYRNTFNKETIKENQRKKNELLSSNYAPEVINDEYYADKGFVFSNKSFKAGNIPITGSDSFSKNRVDMKKIAYLDKIVNMCKKNDIQLILVSGPTTVMRMYNTKGYQEATEYYSNYAKNNGLKYYNLNLLQNRLELLPDELMHDYNHVNGKGAEVTSRVFAEILNKEEAGENTDSYFFNNTDELKKQINYIVAVQGKIQKKKGHKYISISSLQNSDIVPEYKVSLLKDDGNTEILYDYSAVKKFDISGIKGKVIVYARAKGSKKAYDAFQEYNIDKI